MNSKPTRHSIDTLFTFLLLLSFLLFSLLVAGTGSMVYQNGTDSLNKNYTSRMALSYLAEKLRQHDHTDGVNVSMKNKTAHTTAPTCISMTGLCGSCSRRHPMYHLQIWGLRSPSCPDSLFLWNPPPTALNPFC